MNVSVPREMSLAPSQVKLHQIFSDPGLEKLTIFSSAFVPGLVQCEQYIRFLFSGTVFLPPGFSADPDARVKLRQAEQQALLDRQPPLERLTFIIGEETILRLLGHPEVLLAQYEHFMALRSRQNIEIRISPLPAPRLIAQFLLAFGAGGHFGNGPVLYREYYGHEDIELRDTPGNGHIVSKIQRRAEEQLLASLSPDKSYERLEEIVTGCQTASVI